MFGIKFRSWMEAHIVRPRKKRSKEKNKDKKSSTVAENNKSPSPPPPPQPQPLPQKQQPEKTATVKRVTLVSPTLSARVSHHNHDSAPRRPPPLPSRPPSGQRSSSVGRYSTYLSSPESAYSTGYSTDATSPHGYSPGTCVPPEYYINIRTGTRYFQSATERQQQDIRASTSASSTTTADEEEKQNKVKVGHQRSQSLSQQQEPHHHPYCRHTVSKVTCTSIEQGGFSYGAPVPKIHQHKRAESVDNSRAHVTIRTSFAQVEESSACSTKHSNVIQQCNSPRQRSRIRTNPWMSTVSSTVTTTDKWTTTTSSSCSDIAPITPLNEDISTAATIGSWRTRDHDATTTADESPLEEVTAFRRPPRKHRKANRRGSIGSTSSSCSSTPRSQSSGGGNIEDDEGGEEEEDVTLNEMGRFDESYVYEKETDILSDSDPTDCEENIKNFSSDGGSDKIDNNYDELDFIDNGDCELPVQRVTNTGHCTYYHNNNNNNKLNKKSSSRRQKTTSPTRKSRNQKRSHRRVRNLAEGENYSSSGQVTPTPSNSNTPLVSRRNNNINVPYDNIRNFSPRHFVENRNSPRKTNKTNDSPCLLRRNGDGNNSPFLNRRNGEGVNSPFLNRRKDEGINSPFLNRTNGEGINSPFLNRRDIEGAGSPFFNRMLDDSTPKVQRKFSTDSSNTPIIGRKFSIENSTPLPLRKFTPDTPSQFSNDSSNTPIPVHKFSNESNTPLALRRNVFSDNSNNTPLALRRKVLQDNFSNSSTPKKKIDRNTDLPLSQNSSRHSTPSRKFSESEVRLMEADKEADRKYQELIMEAESLLVHMKTASFEEDEIIEIETPVIEEMPEFAMKVPRPRPDTSALHLQVIEPNTPANIGCDETQKQQHIKITRKQQQSVVAIQVTTPSGGPPREIVTFRSIDLSSPVVAEAPYCPQSEPVKRKVYTSAALQRLQEHLTMIDDNSSDSSPPDDDDHSIAKDRLGEKVAALRKERLAAEARLANREEERRKRRERAKIQQQLAQDRRNTLLQTLESLKRDLQIQSASLHDAYSSITDLRSPNCNESHRCIINQPTTPDKPRCDFLSPIRRAASCRYPAPPPPPRRC